MKILYIVLLCTMSCISLIAQTVFESRVKEIRIEIQRITEEEKEMLRKEVAAINQRWDNKEITSEEATLLKNEAAQKSATTIENRIGELEAELQALVKSQVEGSLENEDYEEEVRVGRVTIDFSPRYRKKKTRSARRTTYMPLFAFGKNNVIAEGDLGSINDSDFHIMRSRFYEWGFTAKTRLVKDNNLLHMRYGFSFMYNNLRPQENTYFVKDGNQTVLADFPAILTKEPYFRNVQLVFPVHLEFDFTKKKTYDERVVYRTQRTFRFGLGAYAGFNSRTVQKLRFRENGNDVKMTVRGDFNTNQFIYGTSAYIGYRDVSLYLKYELNSMFKANDIDQNNISLGIRFDFN